MTLQRLETDLQGLISPSQQNLPLADHLRRRPGIADGSPTPGELPNEELHGHRFSSDLTH
jgi:hypothetical protein